MSSFGLFIIGAFVSLLVTASLTLLTWGAVLDGRTERDRLGAESGTGGLVDQESEAVNAFDAPPLPQAH